MKRLLIVCLSAFLAAGCSHGGSKKRETVRPRVVMDTDRGKIVLELFPDVAPKHVKNFLELANRGFYDGLTFHRIIKGFVIQGGDPLGNGTGDAGYTIPAEFSTLKHMPGTLAMARSNDPNSASCQFYICLSQLPNLDGSYTIFGQVVEGMKVVYDIGNVATDQNDKPVTPIRMIRVREEGKERPQTDSSAADKDKSGH